MIVFARLDELKFINGSASLPKYTELSHMVEHDEVFMAPQQNFLMDLTHAASYELKTFKERTGFGKLKIDALLIPDMPYKSVKVNMVGKEGDVEIRYDAPVTRATYPLTNKERKLIELIRDAHAQGKKSLVFHDFVNSGLREDLMVQIEKHTGLRVEELKSSISADKREAYLKAMDCDVLITNPELVKTGLDLLEYPTIIFYQQAYSSYNVFTLRQAAKRAWRIGQEVDCEVHSIAYAGTMQQKALSLIGAKMNISQGVEGRLSSGSDMASEAEDENIQIAMARALLNNEKIENSASSSSKTLDLNAREWNEFEKYYLGHLDAYKADSGLYEDVLPAYTEVEVINNTKKAIIEASKVTVAVEEEVEVVEEITVVTAEDTTPIVEAEDTTPIVEAEEEAEIFVTYFETKKVGRKTVSVAKTVAQSEIANVVEDSGRVQLSLF
jgi:hypothetical protein